MCILEGRSFFHMLTVDINKQSWETGYKVIREVAKTDGK